jgi:arylsulfatase A-like enzyme
MNESLFPKDGGAGRPLRYTEQDWRATFQATYGMVSLIDASVGRVIECLRELGIEDNTTIVFTSDHGDLMGDHFFLNKGPMPCRSLLNIPFIVADPEIRPGVCDAVMSNVDAMPTMLELLGVPIPDRCQGVSMKEVMAGGPVDEEHIALESYWSKESPIYYHHTIHGPKYRISYFPFQDDGELYDLERDPWEFENLYHRPECRELRDEQMLKLFREVGRAEPPAIDTLAWW